MTIREHLVETHGHIAKTHRHLAKIHSEAMAKSTEHHAAFHEAAAKAHEEAASHHEGLAELCAKATSSDMQKRDSLQPLPEGIRFIRGDETLTAVPRTGQPKIAAPADPFLKVLAGGLEDDEGLLQ